MAKFKIKGMAHITGGGFIENIPRMLPSGLGAEIQLGTWPILPIFKTLKKYGEITQEEMFNTFNMGIGFVIAVDSSIVDAALDFFNTQGEQAYQIGKITKQPGVQFVKGS